MSTVTAPKPKASPGSAASKPIDILQSQTSHLYANIHPALLLSVLSAGFKALVQDPVHTLLLLVPAVAALQAAYCVVCLPYSGQPPASTPKPGQKRKVTKPGQETWGRIVPAIIALNLAFTLTAPAFYVLLVLFGAPLTTHLPHTALVATHLALLTAPQLFYVYGLHPQTWLRIASLQLPVDELYGMSLGACVGSWIGAIPIPLDWDREWQKWPVTIVAGMFIGAGIGKLVGGYLLKGSKIKIS